MYHPFFMARGNEILRRLNRLDLAKELSAAAKLHERDFENLNRLQLSQGKNRMGGYLPKYTDDPYFKTIEAAQKYQRWKSYVSPNKDKPADVMDFFIVGKYHKSIIAEVNGMDLTTRANVDFASSIDSKTGNTALGINPNSAAIAWELFIKPYLLRSVSEKTGIGYR